MEKFTPCLWFDKEARQGAELYTSVFPDSNITHITTLHDTPSGDTDIVSFRLAGQPFMAMNGGPYFKPNPSISFQVRCATKDEVDRIWESTHSVRGMAGYRISMGFRGRLCIPMEQPSIRRLCQ